MERAKNVEKLFVSKRTVPIDTPIDIKKEPSDATLTNKKTIQSIIGRIVSWYHLNLYIVLTVQPYMPTIVSTYNLKSEISYMIIFELSACAQFSVKYFYYVLLCFLIGLIC